MLVMCTYYARKFNYGKNKRSKLSEVLQSGRKASLAIITPLILTVGMYTGIFSAPEAGVVGVAYILFISLFIYRSVSLKQLAADFHSTVLDSGIILVLIAMIGFYGWALTRYRIPEFILEAVISVTQNPILIILFIQFVLLIAGALMSTSPSLLILVPLLLPIVDQIGMDRALFGVTSILNLIMGSMTPPVGNVLIILSRVADVPYEKLCVSLVPWYIPFVITIALVLIFPPLSLWLPNSFGF
jgi:tripartite ATP-independent transporter DctM subunit